MIGIDIEKLRNDVMDYFGTAAASGLPMAIMELFEAEKASPRELIQLAEKNGFDLDKYVI